MQTQLLANPNVLLFFVISADWLQGFKKSWFSFFFLNGSPERQVHGACLSLVWCSSPEITRFRLSPDYFHSPNDGAVGTRQSHCGKQCVQRLGIVKSVGSCLLNAALDYSNLLRRTGYARGDTSRHLLCYIQCT